MLNLQKLAGCSGHTSDEQFSKLADTLAYNCDITKCVEQEHNLSDSYTTTYKDRVSGYFYTLFYTTRNHNTPEGYEHPYFFEEQPPQKTDLQY